MTLIIRACDLSKRYLDILDDPEFFDVKIICSDGEMQANKTILSIGSSYFRSMFSSNNNFVESSSKTVKLPYSREVVKRVVLYIYTGKLNGEDLALRSLLDLMELLNMMNFPMEFSKVQKFITTKIKNGNFPLSDCLKGLDDSSKMGLKTVGETLLSYLGGNFSTISQFDEVKSLSEPMFIRLLQEKCEDRSQTILRFQTFVMWLTDNSMEDAVKSEVLESFDLSDFTFKELTSDVRKSGLFDVDKIIERMEELYEWKDNFHITPGFVRKCDIWFDELELELVSEEDVKDFLGEWISEDVDLPDSALDKVWKLSDQGKDGFLDKHEFRVACHLTWRACFYGEEIPDKVVILHIICISPHSHQ